MKKALDLQASSPVPFDVTLDLEDGTPLGREREHAEMVAELLRGLSKDRPGRVGVRVHDIRHPHCEDDLEIIARAAGDRLAYIVLPKARNRGDVEYFASLLQEIASKTARHATWPLHILIESQRALDEVFAIAAHPDVETLDFGSMDFISDHSGAIPSSCMRSPGQFDHALMHRAKTRIVAAALLYGRVPVHNVTLDVRDPTQTEADARRARTEFGFSRMWSVHPNQIQPIIRGMSPTHDEAERAVRILSAAQDDDWGPVRIDDELYDRASYRYEWTVLRRAHLAGRDVGADARARFGLDDMEPDYG